MNHQIGKIKDQESQIDTSDTFPKVSHDIQVKDDTRINNERNYQGHACSGCMGCMNVSTPMRR